LINFFNNTNFFNLVNSDKLWLTKNESERYYWSENHMICYLSSWYLWSQINNNIPEKCIKLLNTFLDNKIKYYYYECFSEVYGMYTLAALLNLYDFTNDSIIKEKTKQCIDIIMIQFNEVINNNGRIFCSTGRTYSSFLEDDTDLNITSLIYMLTGKIDLNKISYTPIGMMLGTSTYTIDESYIIKSFINFNKVYEIGHEYNLFDEITKNLDNSDKTMYKWSAGNYFNYQNINNTLTLIDKYNLWDHVSFKIGQYKTIFKLTNNCIIKGFSYLIDSLTGGSLINKIHYSIYNNNNNVLTSIYNLNKGKLGDQECPWICNLNGQSIFTYSGSRKSTILNTDINQNTHLPYVKQNKNMLLVLYKPSILLKLLSHLKIDLNVYLHLNYKLFTTFEINDKCLYANHNNSYIYICFSSPLKLVDDIYCNTNTNYQSWGIIIDDNTNYQSFDDFKIKMSSVNFKYKYCFNKLSSFISYNNESIDLVW